MKWILISSILPSYIDNYSGGILAFKWAMAGKRNMRDRALAQCSSHMN